MDLLPDLLQVVGRRRERVGVAVEVVEGLGPVHFSRVQVVEAQPELLGELADLRVILVDQLAPVLGDLAVSEGAANRPAAPADTVGGIVDLRFVARLFELVGAGESGKPCADDDYPWRRRGVRQGQPGTECGGGRESRPAGDELPSRGLSAAGFGGDFTRRGLRCRLCGFANPCCEQCASHPCLLGLEVLHCCTQSGEGQARAKRGPS